MGKRKRGERMSKLEARWKGYENFDKESKQHLFVWGRGYGHPVCGFKMSGLTLTSHLLGKGKCKTCRKWERKNKEDYNII